MGDRRFLEYYEAIATAEERREAVMSLPDEQVVQALAAAAHADPDPVVTNVLATEAANRMARSRAITRYVAEGIFAVDATGRVTFVNPAAERLLGWTWSDLFHRRMHEFVHSQRPDGTPLPAEECDILRVLETAEVVESDRDVFVKKDGSTFAASFVAAPILREGLVEGAVVAFRDVTERRRTELLLAAQAALLDDVARGAPLHVVLDGLVRFSEEACTGARASVLLVDESSTRLRHGAAGRLPRAWTNAVDGLPIGPRSGSCGTAAFLNAPVLVPDVETDPRWVEYRHLAIEHGLRACWSTPVRGEGGGVVGTFALYYEERRSPTDFERRVVDVATHIAGIAIVQARHRREAETLAQILHGTDDAVYSTDADGRIATWNAGAARMFGYAPEDAVGIHESVLVPAHRRAEHAVQRLRVMRGERVRQHRTHGLANGDRVLTLSVSVSPLRDANGVIRGTSVIARPAEPEATRPPAPSPEAEPPRVEAFASHEGAPPTPDERERLEALRLHGILDTPPEQEFEDLVELARAVCGTPIALVSLVDEDRQWFKAESGLGVRETPRDLSFCAHAIHDPASVHVVEDASQDDRFRRNALVTGPPFIRFYAGAPIIDPSGHALGTLCVIDSEPRTLRPQEERALRALARQASRLLDLRRAVGDVIAHGRE